MESKDLVSCKILGPGPANSGLGNQLFCIAAALAYARKHEKIASFPQITEDLHYNKYNKIFYHNLIKEPIDIFNHHYTEPSFSFKEICFLNC